MQLIFSIYRTLSPEPMCLLSEGDVFETNVLNTNSRTEDDLKDDTRRALKVQACAAV
jgi:hypothetical protein